YDRRTAVSGYRDQRLANEVRVREPESGAEKLKRVLLALVCACSLAAGAAEPIAIPKVKPGEPLPADLFIQLAKAVNPAVVNVYTTYIPKGRAFPGGRGMPND